ncbi:MAG TPA: FAD-binding oxidoreductase [Anaerolineales bacterium]|nr:FAD-binding oxidoreductase [Anaerolineales bacterium]
MPAAQDLTPLPRQVDVAVLGGGYTGLSAARTLARGHSSVSVLEAETMGWGASSRNGGMVLSGLKLPMRSILKKYGRDLARRLFHCSLEAIDTVEQIVREEAIDCGFARTGHLLTANRPRHFEALKREVEFLAEEFKHEVHLVSRERQREEIGSDLYYGALVDEASAGLNPAQYVAGLARAAQRAGAVLCARARVQHIERGRNGFTVETERGPIRAQEVLVATAGYTKQAAPWLQSRIIPIGSFIIATERLSDDLATELSPKNRMIFDSRHFLNYFRLWDHRLIFGGRAAFLPENRNTVRQSMEILRREMVRVYPQLEHVQVEYAWGGTLDFAFDMMTHVGLADGLHYSLGYAGHGVAMATYLGKTVAEAMLSGRIQDHPFAALPLPGAPLGLNGLWPWFLPLAGIWNKVLDWIE